MSDLWTMNSTLAQRAITSKPDQPREQTSYNRTVNVRISTNERPEQFVNPETGLDFITYSAARSYDRDYCLGQLELVNEDPIWAFDWRKNAAGCVFYRDANSEASGVEHASHRNSPDETQDWIVYHRMRDFEIG